VIKIREIPEDYGVPARKIPKALYWFRWITARLMVGIRNS